MRLTLNSWLLPRATNAGAGLELANGVYSLSLGAERSLLGASLTQIGLGQIGSGASATNKLVSLGRGNAMLESD